MAALPEGEHAITAPAAANLKTATLRLAVDLHAEAGTMESRLHAVERVPPQGRGGPAQFIPVRFTFFNKLTKDHRLLVAFDVLALCEVLGREVSMRRIIHGDEHATLKVKVASLLGTVRKLTGKMSALLAGGLPPDLVLNRHGNECEFRDGCRQRAVEKDDLGATSSSKHRQDFGTSDVVNRVVVHLGHHRYEFYLRGSQQPIEVVLNKSGWDFSPAPLWTADRSSYRQKAAAGEFASELAAVAVA